MVLTIHDHGQKTSCHFHFGKEAIIADGLGFI